MPQNNDGCSMAAQTLSDDYRERKYMSASEVAALVGLTVREVHRRVQAGQIPAFRSASGQYRFRLREIQQCAPAADAAPAPAEITLRTNRTTQRIITADARRMRGLADGCAHLAITSPPYFNAKMYSDVLPADLGNMHDLEQWLEAMMQVWREVFRVLSPGRKFFLNIMNLPVRENGSFRSLNLVGKNVDLCERAGFIFKRDIIWQKTNGVRAHFGTFPNPGGILINNMHESVLEFEKPAPKGFRKYAHLTAAQREASKLDKEFWLSLKNTDVWIMKPEKSGSGREHPAPFPPELPYRLIKAYSYMGETILDPFLGGGTALQQAARLGRNGIGCEINPDYCRLAQNRIKDAEREPPSW